MRTDIYDTNKEDRPKAIGQNKKPKKDLITPFLSFLSFDIPALGFAIWAVTLTRQPKRAETNLLWALRDIKLRLIMSVFIAGVNLFTAVKTGNLSLEGLHGFFSASNFLLQALCDSLTLEAMFL